MEHLGLSERPGAAALFQSFLLDFLLLPYGSHPTKTVPGPDGGAPVKPAVPSGLSESSWKRVAGEKPMEAEVLERQKCGVCKFLGQGFLAGIIIVSLFLSLLKAISPGLPCP